MPDTTELRLAALPLAAPPPELPPIPGGWAERTWDIGERTVRLILPAAPDAFLDDPSVLDAHERDEYMPYWAYVWPASLHMAVAVLRRPWVRGTPAIELGAGVGIVGLAGWCAGLEVVFTDYDATSVDLAVFNARCNGFPAASGEVLDWRSPPERSAPVILGCDILYEDRNHELLLNLLQQMLPTDGIALFGDGGRVRAERFCRMLKPAGFTYGIFDENDRELPQLRVGRYQLIEIRWA